MLPLHWRREGGRMRRWSTPRSTRETRPPGPASLFADIAQLHHLSDRVQSVAFAFKNKSAAPVCFLVAPLTSDLGCLLQSETAGPAGARTRCCEAEPLKGSRNDLQVQPPSVHLRQIKLRRGRGGLTAATAPQTTGFVYVGIVNEREMIP